MSETYEQLRDSATGEAGEVWKVADWDNDRECWVDGDGFRYDGSRFGTGSRSPAHAA
jgi:hypothetical protein